MSSEKYYSQNKADKPICKNLTQMYIAIVTTDQQCHTRDKHIMIDTISKNKISDKEIQTGGDWCLTCSFIYTINGPREIPRSTKEKWYHLIGARSSAGVPRSSFSLQFFLAHHWSLVIIPTRADLRFSSLWESAFQITKRGGILEICSLCGEFSWHALRVDLATSPSKSRNLAHTCANRTKRDRPAARGIMEGSPGDFTALTTNVFRPAGYHILGHSVVNLTECKIPSLPRERSKHRKCLTIEVARVWLLSIQARSRVDINPVCRSVSLRYE